MVLSRWGGISSPTAFLINKNRMKKYIKNTLFISNVLFYLATFSIAKDDQSDNKNIAMPGVIVAKLKPGVDVNGLSNSIKSFPISKISQAFPHHSNYSDLSRIYNIYINPNFLPEEFAAEISQCGIFEYVEPKYLSYITETIPNDTLLTRQFYLSQANMFAAWDIQQGASNIIIAIVDNGTDYQHPDLFENIWTNRAEVKGKPGFDDDGNGYIDDIHGWDFGESDNDPTFGNNDSKIAAHGTHTAGIASAVTNNITGIAGIGWKCKIMPIKTSEDENVIFIPFGYEGIVYAADNGAHIINNSWGRSGAYSEYEQDVINYAVSKGSIVVAAAGNSNSETIFYPAGYVHVIAVAAVNEADQKATYSNFGKFVDISAPGGDQNNKILSTFPVEQGGYGELSGTSMASPIVAGIMGLLRNQFPQTTLLQLSRQIVLTADNIDDQNPDYQGFLGYGRVNGFDALTENVQHEEPAKIEFFKATFHDSLWGNGNFIFERNETIGIDVWYRNFAINPGTNLVVTLSTDDSDLTIATNQVTLGYVPPDSILNIPRELKFLIKPDAKPHVARLALNYSLDNGTGGSDTLISIIGKSSILLVDDDNGKRNVEKYYTIILDQSGVPYLRWDHSRLGTPPSKMVSHFPMIIWLCEWASPGLEPDDRISLQSYLNHNGSLFISGQDIGWDLADPASDNYSEHAAQFYREYLYAEYLANDSQSSKVIGVPGTIGQGMQFNIFQPRISVHQQFPEWIEPSAAAESCFRYDNHKGAGIIYHNTNKVINLGFGFEAVDAGLFEDPLRISRQRSELMERIINFLGPLKHAQLNDMEHATDSIFFQIEISPIVNDLQSLYIFWKTDTMSNFSTLPMNFIGNHVYQQVLNLNSYTGKLQYYFRLSTPYYKFNLPVAGENKPYTFHIGIDRTPPQIYPIQLNDIFIQNSSRNVVVFVEDNIAVDTNSVWLHFATDTEKDSVLMISRGNQWFGSTIPPIAGVGDSVRYYFSACDLATVPNRSVSPVQSYKVGIEGFEYGLDFWISDSNGWAIDVQEFHSGGYCISSSPGQAYENNMNTSIRSKFGLKRKNLKDRILLFWTKYELEDNKDSGFVEISLDNGENWQTIGETITGISIKWYQAFYDLSIFHSQAEDTLLLRFRMKTDSTQSQPMDGWFIDDIAIQSKNSLRAIERAKSISLDFPIIEIYSNSPNPFNAATKITYQLSLSGDVTFEVYNLLGQLVNKLSSGFQPTGQYHLIWNGTDLKGQPCESGIYFGRLVVKSAASNSFKQISKTIKMINLK